MRITFVIVLVCWSMSALGQETASEYIKYTQQQEYVSLPENDISLFMLPLEGGSDVFSTMSAFNFSGVRYLRRGYYYNQSKTYINGIDASDAMAGRPYFSLIGAVRKMRTLESFRAGLASDNGAVGALCGTVERSVRALDATGGSRITLGSTDRRYRWAMDVSSSGASGDGKWGYALAASRRFGRDGHIDGMFTDDMGVSLSVDHVFDDKSALTLFATVSPSEQGLRSASTAEAFELTGNNLYNPSWGYYDGKIRNSKVSRNLQPFVMASYDARLGKQTTLTAALSYHFGESELSGLSWHNAETPQPDYYRAMPSFFANSALASVAEGLWRSNDTGITQINWNEIARQNSLSESGETIYLTEGRIENIGNIQFAATAQSRINSKISASYGLRIRRDKKQTYKKVKDLLGAQYRIDTDQFLTNEDSYGDPLQSDLRNPNRSIGVGDRFGYNYSVNLNMWVLFARLAYSANRFRTSIAAEVGGAKYWREGAYEKESTAELNSYGESKKYNSDTYTIKYSAGYSFSPRQNLDATVMYMQEAPLVDNIFISPLYSNRAAGSMQSPTIAAVEANYNLTLNPVKVKLSAYYTQMRNQSDIYHYYDDISSKYSDMALSGIGKRHYGVELGADVQIVRGLNLRVAGSIARFEYCADPSADIVADADLSTTTTNEKAFLDSYRVGGTPQSIVSAELRYSGGFGWLATLAVNHMADNFIEINPARRMLRTTNLAGSPEVFKTMTDQQTLPSATTVNLFLMKSFTLWKSDFYAIGSINNLLNNKDIVYSGYEQMRLRRNGKGIDTSYAPFDSKYLYSYGRTYFVSITYKF